MFRINTSYVTTTTITTISSTISGTIDKATCNSSISRVTSSSMTRLPKLPPPDNDEMRYESNSENLSIALSLSPRPKKGSYLTNLQLSAEKNDDGCLINLQLRPRNENSSNLGILPQSLSPSPKHKNYAFFGSSSPNVSSSARTWIDSCPESSSPETKRPLNAENGSVSPRHFAKFNVLSGTISPQFTTKADTDNNLCLDSEGSLKPPTSIVNCSPYDCQLLSSLLPRHVSTEHVLYSHRTKVGERSLYFFSPAFRGASSKPVFTTKEKLTTLQETFPDDNDPSSVGSPIHSLGYDGQRRLSLTRDAQKKKDEMVTGGICTLKRVHLFDPACDVGVCVWRGRGPRRGLRVPQSPPCGTGPALLVESSPRDDMAVAVGFSGEVMYLIPLATTTYRTDLESRVTEIIVHEAVLTCISESVVWFTVKRFTKRQVSSSRQSFSNSPKINVRKLKK